MSRDPEHCDRGRGAADEARTREGREVKWRVDLAGFVAPDVDKFMSNDLSLISPRPVLLAVWVTRGSSAGISPFVPGR